MTVIRCAALCVPLLVLICALDGATGHKSVSYDELHSVLDDTDLSSPSSARQLFNLWKEKHGKQYATDKHEGSALAAILDNAKKVKANRQDIRAGATTHELALNKFADMTFEEFKQSKLGFSKPIQISKREATFNVREKRQTLPLSVNWTAQGYVTPVKMQGDCGCCWTFAAAGAVEGQYFKKFHQLISFSEQEFVECVTDYIGCNGGDYTSAFEYMTISGGLATETAYPYASLDGITYGSCKTSTIPQIRMNPTYTYLSNDQQLKAAVAAVGPIAAAVSVADTFMLYTSGVMNPTISCGVPADINHAILVVGYGVDAKTGQSYWLIKNSWDTDWGENGYFRLQSSIANSCGIVEWPIQMTIQ